MHLYRPRRRSAARASRHCHSKRVDQDGISRFRKGRSFSAQERSAMPACSSHKALESHRTRQGSRRYRCYRSLLSGLTDESRSSFVEASPERGTTAAPRSSSAERRRASKQDQSYIENKHTAKSYAQRQDGLHLYPTCEGDVRAHTLISQGLAPTSSAGSATTQRRTTTTDPAPASRAQPNRAPLVHPYSSPCLAISNSSFVVGARSRLLQPSLPAVRASWLPQ